MGKNFTTNYYVAVNWLNNSFVMVNNIVEVDPSVLDNFRFDYYDEENDSYKEIFQWFVTDCSLSDVEYLEEHFGLLFSHSDLLDTYILCADHYGTGWDYVTWNTDLESAKAELGEKK